MKKDHQYYMELAIKLAVQAKGMTSPNPQVGAVVVKNGRIIGRGYHKKAGLSHAEIVALDEAGKAAAGAVLYTTLEPCTHFGRTPPCVHRIIASRLRQVVVGTVDPNPANNGRGIRMLREAGIKVTVGVLEERLKRLNEVFIKYIVERLPFVTVKVAQSLDGKIATATGDSQWITSDRSRRFSHRMRRDYDAIMVGVNTVLRDNPKLDAWFCQRSPLKVIVDSNLSTPAEAAVFSPGSQVIIATLPVRPGQETENRKILESKARILEAKERQGQINLRDMLKKLAKLQIASVLVEGGGTLIGSLFDEGLVDKIIFFVSPKIVGGSKAVSSVMGKGILRIEKAIRVRQLRLRRLGEDILIEGYIR
jgi:diaminohydroxyphosphoribosylaminopyrimidine deaminase/5-amino-6-(5-phosphoribosylamino)uracil reductase